VRVLYVHKNFPAQFGHLAQWLAKHHGFDCTFVSGHPAATIGGVRCIPYQPTGGATAGTHYLSRTFENCIAHAHGVYEACRAHPELEPDLIVGHSGFGSTLFLADLFAAPILNYFEWFYHARGADLDFRPDFPPAELSVLRARARNAMLLLDLQNCAAGCSPTEWQRSQFPAEYAGKIDVIFDGIDTALWRRREGLPRRVAGRELPAGARVVTYAARGFEAHRGFDIFMRIAGRLCRERRDVVVVVVGEDRVCYGNDRDVLGGRTMKEHLLAEGGWDPGRIWFVGPLPPEQLADALSLSDLHIYLTVPFVLSWSCMDALACGCTVLASDTPPVREMITHGRNGLLAGFFDGDAFVAQALRVLDDPAAFRPLGERAAEMIRERYSLDVVLPRMLELYRRVAGKSHGSS
jgi:glycosyltransferase involved in cell wall biosynthesis